LVIDTHTLSEKFQNRPMTPVSDNAQFNFGTLV